MIHRILPILMLIAGMAQAGARSLEPGMTALDTAAPDETLSMHCHVRASAKGKACWGVVWGMTSAADYMEAMLSVPERDTEIYVPEAYVTVSRVQGGKADELLRTRLTNGIDIDGGYNSLKLVYDGVSMRLYAGKDEAVLIGIVPFVAGQTAVKTDTAIDIARNDCHVLRAEAPEVCSVYPDAIIDYLSESPDMNESAWEYLDREVDERLAGIGGRYCLATIRNASGGYDVVYLRGASTNKERWQPGYIKGRLVPTIFRGNYDLQWLDSEGVPLTDDMDATISDDHAILTLRFPVLRSQIRLRRVILK